MKAILTAEEILTVENKIKDFEKVTSCELLMVMAKTSDTYPAASWRFGILAGFFISLTFSYYFELHHSYLWPLLIFVVTLLMVWVGHFNWAKALTLSPWEVDQECMQKAIECFHTMGTSKVSHKVTAMIMVSILERNIEVLVDDKLKEKIGTDDLNELVTIMLKHFSAGNMASGLVESIQSLQDKILKAFAGPVSNINPDELADTIHFI